MSTENKVWVVETKHHTLKGWVPFLCSTDRESAWGLMWQARQKYAAEKFRTVAYTRKFT